jgi:hypothetical protein
MDAYKASTKPMTPEALLELLNQEEGPTLEFKLEFVLDGQGRARNHAEVAKDLLALVNAAGRAGRCAHLVLGAGNQLREDGKRTSKDSKGLYTSSRFLQILNDKCTPLVNDLVYEEVKLQEITYGVLTLMPSTHVHYLARNLETPGYTWPGGSALVRHGDQVGAASPPEIEELHEMIRKRQAARSQASESLQDQGARYPGQLPILPPRLKRDRKNVLRDRGLSARLLRGDSASLAECVLASQTVNIEVAEKNKPIGDWLQYNHFVAPSAVLSIRDAVSGRLIHLGFTRATQPRDPSCRLTTGAAILWTASYDYNLAHQTGSPMDLWIERQTQDSVAAVRLFTEGPECTLLQILKYKIEFVGLDAVCEPFAVITNDLRNATVGRVYTHFVFHVTLSSASPGDISASLSCIRLRPGRNIYALAADFQGDELVGQEGQLNPMEYLAWEGLHNDKPSDTFETARFMRGFAVV